MIFEFRVAVFTSVVALTCGRSDHEQNAHSAHEQSEFSTLRENATTSSTDVNLVSRTKREVCGGSCGDGKWCKLDLKTKEFGCACANGFEGPNCKEFACQSKSDWRSEPCERFQVWRYSDYQSPLSFGCTWSWKSFANYCWRQIEWGSIDWCWGKFDGKYKRCHGDKSCAPKNNNGKSMTCK